MLNNIMDMSGGIIPTDTLIRLLRSPYVHYSKMMPDGRALLYLTNGIVVTLWREEK